MKILKEAKPDPTFSYIGQHFKYIVQTDRGVASPNRPTHRTTVGSGNFSISRVCKTAISCILDTFYDNLKVTYLVYFMSQMKALRGYAPPPSFSSALEELQTWS
jgi:hypothetical protein